MKAMDPCQRGEAYCNLARRTFISHCQMKMNIVDNDLLTRL